MAVLSRKMAVLSRHNVKGYDIILKNKFANL
jgi:hypothetical protein